MSICHFINGEIARALQTVIIQYEQNLLAILNSVKRAGGASIAVKNLCERIGMN